VKADAGHLAPEPYNPHAADTRSRRIAAYIREMFPPALCVPAALFHFAAVYFGLQAMAGHGTLHLTWRGIMGAITTVLFFLLLRVYDELKDVQTDLRLGRAGDPRYKDRAIVTGRIQVADLRALRWAITILIIAINVPLGFPLPFLAFAAVFFVTWLSFHWFFWPAVSRNLLLAFITHNPMAVIIGAYAAAVAFRDFGGTVYLRLLMILLVGIWTPFAAWEVSRKIRIPQDETDYVTYSRILGWRIAAIVPVAFVLTSAICLISVAVEVGLVWIYPAIVLLAVVIVAAACLRFETHPTTASAKLQPYTELYSLLAVAGFSVTLLYQFSITLD
jgi:4-hydroxybenzoate polyprenyltransferase